MHPAGEIPITSYFTRVPPKKKRKANPPLHSDLSAKRKRHAAEDLDEAAQVVKREKKEQKQRSLDFSTRGSHSTAPARTSGGTSRRAAATSGPLFEGDFPISLDCGQTQTIFGAFDASHAPRLKSNSLASFSLGTETPGSRNSDPSHCSVRFPSSRRNASVERTPRGKPNNAKGKAVSFATPPSVSQDHPDDGKHSLRNTAHDTRDNDFLSSSTPLSSQSHNVSSPAPVNSLLSESLVAGAPGPAASQPDDPVPSSQSQYLSLSPPSPRRFRSAGVEPVPSSQSQYMLPTSIERDDDGFVVPSSQSQWLLPVHVDGEYACDSVPHTVDVIEDEIVPSSQSQFELELIPRNGGTCASQAQGIGADCGQLLSPIAQTSDINAQSMDMFEDPLPPIGNLVADRDDSETESDDDPPPVLPRVIEHIHPESSVERELEEPSLASSLGSLPGAVKDFFDMFGSGSGSYPASFPESLKWKDGDSQDEY
ncbi:hypothetical protein C8R43DRAFT_1037089 [Mycena crocata]|nr:hypothetical protein C8R43DRAFT_1037089 [Mycena crocata]